MSDYTELVQRLREQYMDTKQMLPNVLCHDSADAITALQARVAELEPYVSGARCPNCDNLRLENGELRQDLAALVELGKERDYAMEMVNVQDNQIDALRADLAAARAECVRRQTIIGEVALERDAARARLDSVAERDRLAIAAVEGVQQMRIDLATARATIDTMQGGYDRAAKMILDLRADAARWKQIVTEIADDDGCSASTARLIDAALAGKDAT